MSTHDLTVKLSSSPGAEKNRSSVESAPPEQQPAAGGHEHTARNRNDPTVAGTSTDSLQATKNLYIRRRILLKSKGDRGSTTKEIKEISDQLRFTSFLSLRLPPQNGEKNGKDSETQLSRNNKKPDAVRRPANVQHPKLKTYRESTGKVDEDENLSKPPIGKGCTTIPQKNHFGHDISCHGSKERIQRGVALCEPETAQNCIQESLPSPDHLTQQPITESKCAVRKSGVNNPFRRNAEEALCYSNLIPFGEASSSKASTNYQPAECSTRVLKRALSLPSFPAPHHSCKSETEPSDISPSAAMFTSTLVSVLAPHWNGHFRRPKRDVSVAEQDSQLSGQNSNLSAFTQNASQQPLLSTQMRTSGESSDKVNNKLREPAGTSRCTVEWQKDATTSPHLSATLHTIRPLLKPTPLDASQRTVDVKDVEFRTYVPLPLDTNQMTRSALSLQVRGYKRISQPMDQGETFSPPTSRPTTSSLLLSWRRLNSRKENAESTEMEKQMATSVKSLTLPNKSKCRISQPPTPTFSPDDPTKANFQQYTFPVSPDQLQSPETSLISPNVRENLTSRSMFLINKESIDISNKTTTVNETKKDRMFLSSTIGSNQPESLNAFRQLSKDIPERKCSHLGNNESVQQRITDCTNSNIDRHHKITDIPSTCISHKDSSNSNMETSVSDSNHISHNIVQNRTSEPTEISPNLRTSRWSNGLYNAVNSNKANNTDTASTSQSTSSKSIQRIAAYPLAGITSTNLTRTPPDCNQISTNNTRDLCPGNLSPSPTIPISERTFTDSLVFTPKKEISTVERTSPSHVWQNYLNKRQSQSNQTPSEQTRFLSSCRPLRRVNAPSIYSYLRETSPPLTTQFSSALTTSPSPQSSSLKQDGNHIPKENQNAGISRFTFDLSDVESRDVFNAPQSLPPDVGRSSAARFSKSPYSTLISARPRLNRALHSHTSPSVSHRHSKSASYDSSGMIAVPPNADTFLSVQKDNWIQGISGDLGYSLSSSNNHITGETTTTQTLKACSTSQSSPDARPTDYQTANLIPDTTLPLHSGIVSRDIWNTGPDGIQSVKSSTYTAPQEKNRSSPLSMHTVTEAVPAITQEEITKLQTHETLQGIQHCNSKRSLFSRSKKDNSQTSSDYSAGQEGLTHQEIKNEEMIGQKYSNRMDQVFNRLKLTFSVRRSEDNLSAARKKTKNFSQQSLDLKASECKNKEVWQELQTLKSPLSSSSQITTRRESYKSSGPLSGFTFLNKKSENLPNVDKHKRPADENGNQFLAGPQSPTWPKPHYINRYATMPQTRKNTAPGSSHNFFPAAYSSKDSQNEDVFDSLVPARTKNTFVCNPENVPDSGNAQNSQRQRLMGAHLSASCADLKYGLERGRSVSVSSIVSGRPSGPGRISTGSRQGSISDFSSLDEFAPRSRHSSISSPGDSTEYGVSSSSSLPVHNTYRGCVGQLQSNDLLWSPGNLDSSNAWDTEANPTPPSSPPFSPTSRRMSQCASSSSTSSRTSLDSLSPRGFLPSRSYKTTLSVFEEYSSDSETTTDDEYYLKSGDDDDDDEKETEL